MNQISEEALVNIFTFHPANTIDKQELHEAIRRECLVLAKYFNLVVPNSEEKGLAIRHLQYAMMMANSAIAQD